MPQIPDATTRVSALRLWPGVLIVALVALNAPSGGPLVPVTITDTPTQGASPTAEAEETTPTADATEAETQSAAQGISDFATPTLRATDPPTLTPVPVTDAPAATDTPQPTDMPTETHTPTVTPTVTNTPTATLPPQGIQGEVDLLELLNNAQSLPFNPEMFAPVEGGWRIMPRPAAAHAPARKSSARLRAGPA